jgi:hypothetical protein
LKSKFALIQRWWRDRLDETTATPRWQWEGAKFGRCIWKMRVNT